MNNIVLAHGLTPENLIEIKTLEDICNSLEPLNMKLNWESLEARPKDQINDLLIYDDSLLVGFMGLYSFGNNSKEVEITGMVHPSYRRKGIFQSLFDLTIKEHLPEQTENILLITERSSEAGISFAKKQNANYSFSEYKMKYDVNYSVNLTNSNVTLRKAEEKDFNNVLFVNAQNIGVEVEYFDSSYLRKIYDQTFVIEINKKCIGKICIFQNESEGFFFGFNILEEYRGNGYGKETLNLAITMLLEKNITDIQLEVETKNMNALTIYKDCGFVDTTIYDYYEIII